MTNALDKFTVDSILSRMHYYRCHDYTELVALGNLLPDIISQHPKVIKNKYVSTHHADATKVVFNNYSFLLLCAFHTCY